MRLDKAKDVRIGDRPVDRIMLGGERVWPEDRLEIEPDVIWLLRAKDWTEYVNVLANVKWSVG